MSTISMWTGYLRTTAISTVLYLLMIGTVLAEPLQIVRVSASDLNCVFHPSCRVTVRDSTDNISLPGGSGTGFLQSRTFEGVAGAPAAGQTGYEYRVDLQQVSGIVDTPCVRSLNLDVGPMADQLDYNDDGSVGEDVYVVSSGGLGSIGLANAERVGDKITFFFDDGGVCAGSGPGGGESSFFFGFSATTAPREVQALLTARDGTELVLAARAPTLPLSRRADFSVDPNIQIPFPSIPGFSKNDARPVGAIADEAGLIYTFVENELAIVTNDPRELDAFLERWNGKVLATFDPSRLGLDSAPEYLVRVDVSRARADDFTDSLLSLGYTAGGTFRATNGEALKLLAVAARENLSGRKVDVNWLAEPDQFRGAVSTEAPNGATMFDSAGNTFPYTPNAFQWPTHSRGSPQDIGVGAAWAMLERTGRIRNKSRIAVIDAGFSVQPDFPWMTFATSLSIDPRTTRDVADACANPCTHGTDVASALMAIPDNGFGAAGPAGPVTSEAIMIYAGLDRFSVWLAFDDAVFHGADIVNMSFSSERWQAWAWQQRLTSDFDEITRALRRLGILLFASAGNNGSRHSTGIFSDHDWPCHNAAVICVGGLEVNSKGRHPSSDFGSGVDIFAPFVLFAGPNSVITDGTRARVIAGTSFASPFAAGVAALIRAANPSLTANQVEGILLRTAHPSPDADVPRYVNAAGAVAEALVRSGIDPLTIRIIGPSSGARISAGSTRRSLVAEVFDLESVVPRVEWTSDVEGVLGTGPVASHIFTRTGTQTITATAFGSDGGIRSDSVRVLIVNDSPVMSIETPRNGAVFARDNPIPLDGRSYDPNERSRLPDSAVRWYIDDAASPVATGHAAEIRRNTVTIGPHTLRFRGSDGVVEGSATVGFRVVAPVSDSRPTVRIMSPTNGEVKLVDTWDRSRRQWYVTFDLVGEAIDPEDGRLSGSSLVWAARHETGGTFYLGTGDRISARFYALQPFATDYEVVLTATDRAGNVGEYVILLKVDLLS